MDTKILHVDIDSFLASVEQVHNPDLRGKPVAVGSGIVASCSIEAKRFGIRAVMSIKQARRICPSLIVVPGDSKRVQMFKEKVKTILERHSPRVENTSLDDFYVDLTGILKEPKDIALSIREEVKENTGLSVSQGIGSTRTIARLATEIAKPGKIVEIPRSKELEFLGDHAVEKLPGIGKRKAELLKKMGIKKVRDLRSLDPCYLKALFGKNGEKIWLRANAKDKEIISIEKKIKTISRETSFDEPESDPEFIKGMVLWLLERSILSLRSSGKRAGRVDVYIRYADNKFEEAGRRLYEHSDTFLEIKPVVLDLLDRVWKRRILLRGVGIKLSQLVTKTGVQDGLWEKTKGKMERLEKSIEKIRSKHGFGRILYGREAILKQRLPLTKDGFILRTPSLSL